MSSRIDREAMQQFAADNHWHDIELRFHRLSDEFSALLSNQSMGLDQIQSERIRANQYLVELEADFYIAHENMPALFEEIAIRNPSLMVDE